MSHECRSVPEYRYADVASAEELGPVMSEMAAEGFVVEVREPSAEKPEDGDEWKAGANAVVFRVSAFRDLCRCRCEACGHTNGDESQEEPAEPAAKKRKAR